MNTRLLYFLLAVQFLFAGALIFVGLQVRAKRRLDYLELTHRVTSGRAQKEDFEKLAALLPEHAEREEVRALFGLPLLRTEALEIFDGGASRRVPGESWIYFPCADTGGAENQRAPIDKSDAEKLTGNQTCFAVTFDARGRASARVVNAPQPIPAR